MKRISYLLFLVFLLVHSCGNSEQKHKRADKCVCVLVDLSYSTHGDHIRQSYVKDLRKVMAAMEPGDVLVVGLITDRSISELDFCLQHEFPVFKPHTDSPLFKRAEMKKWMPRLQAMKDSLLRVAETTIVNKNERITKTEIMGALLVAERVFLNYHKQKNILLLMSDMLEDSQFYNFHRNPPKDSVAIRHIIETERRNDRLPHFVGGKVYVTGAMAPSRTHYLQVRNFWIRYFRACGAALQPANYGSMLIEFDE